MMDGHLSKNLLAPLRGFRAWFAETGLSSLTCIMQGVRLDFEWLIWAENSPVFKKKNKIKGEGAIWAEAGWKEKSQFTEKAIFVYNKSFLWFWPAQSLRSHLKWSRTIHQYFCSRAKSNECPGSLSYLFLLKNAQTEENWNTRSPTYTQIGSEETEREFWNKSGSNKNYHWISLSL